MQKLMLVLLWCVFDLPWALRLIWVLACASQTQTLFIHTGVIVTFFVIFFLFQNRTNFNQACDTILWCTMSLHINWTKLCDFIEERVIKAMHVHHTYICNWETATVCLSVCLEPPFTLWPEKDGCYYTSNHKPQYDRERWQVCRRQERGDIKEIDRRIAKVIEKGWLWRRQDRLIERE